MIERLAKDVIDKSNQGLLSVPMLPEVAQKAMILATDPDSDAANLAKLIQMDQSLAAHVMRIANSATYSPNGNIVSLQQAISRLGMGLIAEITLTATLSSIQINVKGYNSTLQHIWQHALASALWAKEICRLARKNVEAAYISGLLHSIGKAVIIQELAQDPQNFDKQQVLKVAALCFRQVGQRIVSAWQMPEVIVQSIYPKQQSQLADAVKVASMFARIQLSETQDWSSLQHLPQLDSLNLYEEDVLALVSMQSQIQSATEAMTL